MSTTDLDFVQIPVPIDRIEEFCHRWHVVEFALFGSVLTEEFRPDSDVDVMVTFEPGYVPDIHGLVAMDRELEDMYGRTVDLVEKASIVNPFRRHHVMHHHRVLYAA